MDFHHFPNFDPSYGKPGDTLTWFPPSQLRVSDPDKQYPPLYYSPKENVCQHCPDFEHFNVTFVLNMSRVLILLRV